MRRTFGAGLGSTLAVIVLAGGLSALRAEGLAPKPEPERYGGIIMVTNAPATGVIRVKLTIERYSTVDERKAYADVIKSKGSEGLAQAMESVTVGYIQFDQNLRYPLAYAIKVPTEKGEMLRVATNRPISFREQTKGFVSKDYPIGIMELQLPKDGPGDGFILAATAVQFNDKGQLEVKSLPQNTGPQRVSQVEREEVKKKKAKD
jgi:hypothetical protein